MNELRNSVLGVSFGQIWRHARRTDAIYKIEGIVNQHTTNPEKFPVSVIYSDSQGRVWCRPMTEFLNKFMLSGPKR